MVWWRSLMIGHYVRMLCRVCAAAAFMGGTALIFVLHLPTSQTQAHSSYASSSTAGHASAILSPDRIPVGIMLPPDCVFQSDTTPRQVPAGATLASLNPVPSDIGQSIAVAFTPCSSSPQAQTTAVQPADVAGINFHIVSVTRYQGSGGTVYIAVIRPSDVAWQHALQLGGNAGTRADGADLFSMTSSDSPSNGIEWRHGDLLVQVSSDLPLDRLTALANDVTLSP